MYAIRFTRLFVLGAFLIPAGIQARDLYVATNGTPYGPGTLAKPYDLTTALLGLVGKPGDTFWLKGGNYVIGHVDTKIQGEPGRPFTFRSMPDEQTRVDGSLTFFDSAGWVAMRDFELYSSDTNRVSTQRNVGFKPGDIKTVSGINSFAPNMSFINLVVHDETKEGIYISQSGSNNLVYGCVLFNNGWRSLDNAEGHGIYVQGSDGGREIADNICCNNAGVGLHIYDNERKSPLLAGITLDGNTAFNAGAIQGVRFYRDWIVGVDAPSTTADDIVFENNMGYVPLAPDQNDTAQIGRDGINGNVAIRDNYLPAGLELNNWTRASVTGNSLAAQSGNHAVILNQKRMPLAANWDDNIYTAPASAGFMNNSKQLNFSSWQDATGYDSNSTITAGKPGGTKVFIRPNRYEPNRANIIVYNWDNLDSESVSVGNLLTPGTHYVVRNAADFFGKPVLSGTYDGKPLVLPMKDLTVAKPNGAMPTAPATGPTFNVFVLLESGPPESPQRFQSIGSSR